VSFWLVFGTVVSFHPVKRPSVSGQALLLAVKFLLILGFFTAFSMQRSFHVVLWLDCWLATDSLLIFWSQTYPI
jgi:hypothetical protein